MKTKFNNRTLNNDLSKILRGGFIITKGTISGFSIEVLETNPTSYNSYIYYEDEKGRDEDLKTLTELLESK